MDRIKWTRARGMRVAIMEVIIRGVVRYTYNWNATNARGTYDDGPKTPFELIA